MIPSAHETQRLERLQRCRILDTAPEPAFDELVREAARLLSVTHAHVGLVDFCREWLKAKIGWDEAWMPRASGFAQAVLDSVSPKLWTREEPDSPLAKHRHLKFAATFPIVARDGIVLGALTVAGPEERTLDASQKHSLEFLARQTAALIEARIAPDPGMRAPVFRAFAVSTPDAIVVLDQNGKVLFANPAMERMFGYTPLELVGQSLTLLMPARYHEAHLTGLMRAMTRPIGENAFEPMELLGLRRDGTEIPLEISRACYTIDGLRRYAGIMRDCTARKRSEDQIRDQQERMVHASKMSALGEMAGGMAHEINNPLAIIHGKAGQLRKMAERGVLDVQTLRQCTEKIESTSMRIARIVRGLRAFAREGANDPFSACCVADVVEDALELCRDRLSTRGIAVKLPVIPKELVVECRPSQIAQVLLNLFINARDAIEQAEEKWIRLEFCECDDSVCLAITDSGPGIPRDLHEKIFHPFFTTKEAGKGTGLGLSVSQGIMESHLGCLSLDEDSPNTRFVLRLPKRRPVSLRKAA